MTISNFCSSLSNSDFMKLDPDTAKFFIYAATLASEQGIGKKDVIEAVLAIKRILATREFYNISARLEYINSILNGIAKTCPESKKGILCIKDSSSDLLSCIKIDKGIGEGTFGNVFMGHLAAQPEDMLAIKLAKVSRKDINFPLARFTPGWLEYIIQQEYINPLIRGKICPNFPYLFTGQACDSCAFSKVYVPSKKSLQAGNFPCGVFLSELATGDMVKWAREEKPDQALIMNALFQIMAALCALQERANIVNNDVKLANTLYLKVSPGGYWKYNIRGVDFYVENLGYVFLIGDFGVSEVLDTKAALFNSKKEKVRSIGSVAGIIVGDKLTPIKYANPGGRRFDWVSASNPAQVKESYALGYDVSVDAKGQLVLNDILRKKNVVFTDEQKAVLNSLGIPHDINSVQFYQNPKVIPTSRQGIDTQDAISMFIGGVERLSQPGQHLKQLLFDDSALRKYISPVPLYKVHGGSKFFNEKIQFYEQYYTSAGFFIKKFFTDEYNMTTKPSRGKEIDSFTI